VGLVKRSHVSHSDGRARVRSTRVVQNERTCEDETQAAALNKAMPAQLELQSIAVGCGTRGPQAGPAAAAVRNHACSFARRGTRVHAV
jgi:hypothetical protein